MFESIADTTLFSWVILPLLIFLSRIADQSIGTLRVIFLSKGFRVVAPVLGFFEVIIWLLAVSQIMKHLDNVLCYVAYGAGFAAGNYIGILLDEKLSIGTVLLRIIPQKDTTALIQGLRDRNFGFTYMDANGARGPVKVIMTIIKRKDVPEVASLIQKNNPTAFYTIEEVKSIHEGVFKPRRSWSIQQALPFQFRKFK
ncbi:MAG: DUF2179 domain-containing protein [Bacteroidales bacterium]|nr:DUF2179 domain-containing protein [Bacteroidales bacterium]